MTDMFERPNLSDEEAAQQLGFEQALLSYVVDGTALPEDTVRPVTNNLYLAEFVLAHVNEQIPRPIHPDSYGAIKERAGKVNRWMTGLWEVSDARARNSIKMPWDEDRDTLSLPSMAPEVRYGLVNSDMRRRVRGALSGRHISL